MKNTEIVGIIIVVILLIVLGVSIWTGQDKKGAPASPEDICDTNCIQVDEDNWTSPIIGNDGFGTKEECVSECLFRIKQQ